MFGEGPPDARLVLIGEVPGDKEDLAGHPFVGPAGKVLDDALEDVGHRPHAGLPHQRGQALQVRAARQGAHPQEAERGRDRRVPASGGKPRSNAVQPRGARHPRRDRRPGRVRRRSSASRSNAGSGSTAPAASPTLATIHPSAVLRAPPERRDEEYAGLVARPAADRGARRGTLSLDRATGTSGRRGGAA